MASPGSTWLLAVFLLASGPRLAAQDSLPVGAPPDELWITLGTDAFATAERTFPASAARPPLPRFAEALGVVLTHIPRSDVADLSLAIHHDLRRCGGFVAHESLADAQAELARIAATSQNPARGTLPFSIDQPLRVGQLAGQVSEAQILATITTLSTQFVNRYQLHPTGTAAAEWIRDLWLGYAAGRPGVTVELVSHSITPQPSVVLTLPGTTLPEEVVILGGHLDSIGPGTANPNFSAPGADDDASGIASLSEVVRVAFASGFAPQRTIKVMAYAAEEVGLRGSTDIATTFQTAGTQVVAVLQLDMTGYQGSVEDIALISDFTNPDLTAFLGDLLDTYQPDLVWTTSLCGYACSDHAPWHNRGYRASFAFESRFGQHNNQIHTIGDTVATLGQSATHAAKFSRLAAAFLVETSLDGATLLFADGFESGDTSAWDSTVP